MAEETDLKKCIFSELQKLSDLDIDLGLRRSHTDARI